MNQFKMPDFNMNQFKMTDFIFLEVPIKMSAYKYTISDLIFIYIAIPVRGRRGDIIFSLDLLMLASVLASAGQFLVSFCMIFLGFSSNLQGCITSYSF